MGTELWSIIVVIIAGAIASFGPIFMKKGVEKFSIKSIYKNFNLILGVFFYATGALLFIPALKGGDLSILYPLVALMYVWISLLSVKMLGEKMNKFKWMGIFLIIIGVILINL